MDKNKKSKDVFYCFLLFSDNIKTADRLITITNNRSWNLFNVLFDIFCKIRLHCTRFKMHQHMHYQIRYLVLQIIVHPPSSFLLFRVCSWRCSSLGVLQTTPPAGSTLLQESPRHQMCTLFHATGAWQPRRGRESARLLCAPGRWRAADYLR